MGRGNNRMSQKMKNRRGQNKKKARLKRRMETVRASRKSGGGSKSGGTPKVRSAS